MIELIRNFSIIAHIDHGKSTLADRLLEYTHTVAKREMRDQILDGMELERERGITIKAKAIRLSYTAADKKTYILNLIDTPGHVDFSYEVSRSLSACEGCVLVVDASQGVEAQTISNIYLAQENHLRIIPIVNKIDLPNAKVEDTKEQIWDLLKDYDNVSSDMKVLEISAKRGIGTEQVLEEIVRQIPPPIGSVDNPLHGLIFDSVYDPYRGAVIYVRMFDGIAKKGMVIQMASTGKKYEILEVGHFHLKIFPSETIEAGNVGYIAANIKDIHDVKIGDSIFDVKNPSGKVFSGFREIKPFVFCSLYTEDNADYGNLQKALERLRLNDTSFEYKPEKSTVLGFGYHCGFLGILHMDIITERIRREFNLKLILTVPTVSYKIKLQSGEIIKVDNPAEFPNTGLIEEIHEPYVKATILTPSDFIGNVMKLMESRRAKFIEIKYLTPVRVMFTYELPLGEIVTDYYDKLKSITQGYASFDYQHIGYKPGDIVKLEILINHEIIDALSFMMDKKQAEYKAQKLVDKLKETLPRQNISVPIQAKLDNRIIARADLKAFRKDVIAGLYGGDVTRKNKLLNKQKEGKKKMEKYSKLNIPQEAFFSILKLEE